jgi:hypothetical protein
VARIPFDVKNLSENITRLADVIMHRFTSFRWIPIFAQNLTIILCGAGTSRGFVLGQFSQDTIKYGQFSRGGGRMVFSWGRKKVKV